MNRAPHTLLVGPYVGEFGWELMNWQGRVRRVAEQGDYDRIVVCALPDRRCLYVPHDADGRVVFCPMDHLELPGAANEDHRVGSDGERLLAAAVVNAVRSQVDATCRRYSLNADGAEYMSPGYRSELWPTIRAHQSFCELRQNVDVTTDIVLVPRQRDLAAERNQPRHWWDELARRLTDSGLAVEVYAQPLDAAIRQLSRARLAVGASTGGLHLASLCRCPHYVWGSGSEARWTGLGITNRQRYETVWNPLGTPCWYDECGWQPEMSRIVDCARRALDEIGLPRGRRRVAWSLRPTWRLKRRLSRVLDGGGAISWPWRLRRIVREQIL